MTDPFTQWLAARPTLPDCGEDLGGTNRYIRLAEAYMDSANDIIAHLLEDRRVLREALEHVVSWVDPHHLPVTAEIAAKALEATRPDGSPLGQP